MNLDLIRKDFPILSQKVHGKNLIYLDNAATSQKPISVIETIQRYYLQDNANIHRGVHLLSERATHLYEQARLKIQKFIGAEKSSEIIFTQGTTESINLVAAGFSKSILKPGDEVLISYLEHHSNIVPWQIACESTGAVLKVIPMTDSGELIYEEFQKLLSSKTKLLAITHISNALGTINPIQKMIEEAHRFEIPVLIDGAQSVPHLKINVQKLDCDFFAFSGHKMCGPTGIGILYGKEKWLDRLPPYQSGGDMIQSVSFEKTLYNHLPYKFEAGTPPIAEGIGLGAAVDYLEGIGMDAIALHEQELLQYATQTLSLIPTLEIIGTAKHKASVVSFELKNIHPHDIGTILDSEGIAIRTGHHCAMPIMKRLKVPATARASFAFYNTMEEIDQLAMGIQKVLKLFQT
ncbi:MAG: cysteine desulfurase [Deltaproteobacteria bacterium]|nr:cysteine desulfurase [Deltaproteobacteria bacterium]